MIKKIEDLNYYELLEVSPQATPQEIHKAYERIRRVYEPNSMALYSLFSPEETAAITQRIEEAYRTLEYEDNRKRYDEMLKGREDLPDLPPLPSEPLYPPHSLQPTLSLPFDDRTFAVPEPPVQQSVQQPVHQPIPKPVQQPTVQPVQQPAPQPALPKIAHETVTQVSQFIAEFNGSAIRMLREQNNLTVRHIADRTKVGARYIECIEEEDYAKLPARAYIRGFLMLYAKALGCEPERMAGDYLKRYDAAMTPAKK